MELCTKVPFDSFLLGDLKQPNELMTLILPKTTKEKEKRDVLQRMKVCRVCYEGY